MRCSSVYGRDLSIFSSQGCIALLLLIIIMSSYIHLHRGGLLLHVYVAHVYDIDFHLFLFVFVYTFAPQLVLDPIPVGFILFSPFYFSHPAYRMSFKQMCGFVVRFVSQVFADFSFSFSLV